MRKWQDEEQDELRPLCQGSGVLLSILTPETPSPANVYALVRDFHLHTEQYNLSLAEKKVDDMVASHQGRLDTMLVIDADRTLAATDSTERLFWEELRKSGYWTGEDSPLLPLFCKMRFCYKAFRQATLLQEEAANPEEYEALCQHIAASITMYPEFVTLLQQVATQPHAGAIIISTGLRRIWEIVLSRHNLSHTAHIIAGGRLADGLVVTAPLKAALVARLQAVHHTHVIAFGHTPLALPMLKHANLAILVVGATTLIYRDMEEDLTTAIRHHNLRARQVLLTPTASPRLCPCTAPLLHLSSPALFAPTNRVSIIFAPNATAAALLTRPLHRNTLGRAGAYLATELLSTHLGIEAYTSPPKNTQGGSPSRSPSPSSTDPPTPSHRLRLRHEHLTAIIALSSGGDLVAAGIVDVFPQVYSVHVEEIEPRYLEGMRQVLLVDAVVGRGGGKWVCRALDALRWVGGVERVVVVAGVVEGRCLEVESKFCRALEGWGDVGVVALRREDGGGAGAGDGLGGTTGLA